MKKHFLITLLLLVFAMAATAQNKKIAILETVDKKGNVPYGICLQLRSSLTYAISSTPGYEGYDRVDMASIMGEHDFQRTGMVSDEQIRKLGEMTGASSILVAEAAIYDKDNIIITAKILNVETTSVERAVPPQISSTNPREMQKACEELADKLLVKVPIIPEETQPVGVVEESKIEFITGKMLTYNGKDYFGNDSYSLDGQKLTPTQYTELLKNCPDAWQMYKKGKRMKNIGWITMASGVACTLIGVWPYDYSFSESTRGFLAYSGIAGGVGLTITSIVLFVNSKEKRINSYKIYNQYCAQPQATLSFGPTANGIGVCLSF